MGFLMRWAITPRGIGQPVSFRAINSDEELQAGEFASTTDPAGLVLAQDGASLRVPTGAEVLMAAKAERLNYLRERRNQAIEAGIEFNGRQYWTDRDSVLDLASALIGFLSIGILPAEQVAQLPVPSTVPWKTRDGYVSHTLQELVLLYAAISTYRLAQHQIEEQLIDAVNAATTVQQVAAVDWPA